MMKRFRPLILCTISILAIGGLVTYFVRANAGHSQEPNTSAAQEGAHHISTIPKTDLSGVIGDIGILSNATVSFGSWMTTPALDRFPNASPGAANHHELKPRVALIRAGGTVNFVIAGLHQVIVYGNGIDPSAINITLTVPPTGAAGPPLINDPNGRIYRGLDPTTQPRDRVEVVRFAEPGLYLVICGVLPHFQEGMYGYVQVLR